MWAEPKSHTFGRVTAQARLMPRFWATCITFLTSILQDFQCFWLPGVWPKWFAILSTFWTSSNKCPSFSPSSGKVQERWLGGKMYSLTTVILVVASLFVYIYVWNMDEFFALCNRMYEFINGLNFKLDLFVISCIYL